MSIQKHETDHQVNESLINIGLNEIKYPACSASIVTLLVNTVYSFICLKCHE